MEDSARSSSAKIGLPLILLAAVIQGWVLFALHHAVREHHWPATDQAWLLALYALAVFVPLTLQFLAQHVREAALWLFAAVLATAYFYFGWHHGASVSGPVGTSFNDAEGYFPFALLSAILWLLVLPFVQSRLRTGHWTIRYPALFADAWRNKLVLAEAVLFTGLFWLLLFLWQMLFHMLGIDYFRELFEEPIFVYPVTALTFGCALHLIGSIEALTAVVLEQVLNVLKWLALVAGVILVFFTIALVLRLPGLVFTGQKAIGASWLLWLVAVVVLLLNAAYRDGSVAQPYPKWMALFLRAAAPLTVIVSATALYALITRAQYYGLTVERVWAFVVAGAAMLYSIGYSASVFGKGAWLGSIARINIIVALALMVVIGAALSPLLSPYRLSADSQFQRVRARGLAALEEAHAGPFGAMRYTPLQYLRFDAGRYGRARLQELAELQAGKDATDIRQRARNLLAQQGRWAPVVSTDFATVVAKMRVYPVGRGLDKNLTDSIVADLNNRENGFSYMNLSDSDVAGVYVDLNGDKSDEFVFMTVNRGLLYENLAGQWRRVGNVYPKYAGAPRRSFDLIDELAKGEISVVPPKWSDLSIGGRLFRVNER